MKLKSLIVFTLGAALLLGQPIPLAAASTYPLTVKHFIFNGKLISSPEGIAAKDPSTNKNTTYVPVYYVMQALRSINIQSHWNGTDWDLEIPSTIQPSIDLSSVNVSANSKYIQLNGIPIQSTPAVVYPDPASHVDTTYMPIWYVMKILNDLKITSHWDGTTWNMQGALNGSTNQGITFTYAFAGQHLMVGDPNDAVLNVSVKNASGKPVAGQPVTLNIGNDNIASVVQSTVTTDQNGDAALNIKPGQKVGITTLHATCNGESGFTSVTTVPVPRLITVTPSTSTIIANTNVEPSITFRATYANGIPAVGIDPTEDLLSSTPSWNLAKSTMVTNENGEIVDTIVGTGLIGSGTLGESIQTNKAMVRSSVATIAVIQGVDSAHSKVNLMPSTITSGRESQVTLTVKNSQNEPVSGLSANAFRLELPNQSAATSLAPTKIEDQGKGNYTLTFCVGGISGDYVDPGQQPVEINVNSIVIGTSSVQVQEDAPVANASVHDTLKLLSTPYGVGKNSYPSEALTYQVTDPSGHPVPNIHVFFTTSSPSLAILTPSNSVFTDADGKISACVDTVGPQDFGTVSLTASIDGVSSITTPIPIENLGTVQLSAVATTMKAGNSTPDIINVLALDANGNPIPNYYLSVDAYVPLECKTAYVVTDASGHAQVPVTAGNLPVDTASVGTVSIGDTHGVQSRIDIKVEP